jgi:ABC-type uncharacterized transport system permease subunit
MILSSASTASGLSAGLAVLSGFSVAALIAYALAALMGERVSGRARAVLVLAWLAHAVAIAVDLLGFGGASSGARFGFGPALSVTVWLVVAVYALESRFVPMPGMRRKLAVLAGIAVVVAWVFPGEFRPQAPSPWAPLHWVLGIASYGLFGAAVLHAVMLNRAERSMRERSPSAAGSTGVPLLRLERLTFHFVAAGFAMLSAALLAGLWFASPWRWDHKTVFSLLGWVVFAGLLVGRRAFGWRGVRATRWLYAGATLLFLAYVGSRFVLEVLLTRQSHTPLG